jgi:hypothetical protein
MEWLAKYEPTGRAKRCIHGVPEKESLDAVREALSNNGVLKSAKAAYFFWCIYIDTTEVEPSVSLGSLIFSELILTSLIHPKSNLFSSSQADSYDN